MGAIQIDSNEKLDGILAELEKGNDREQVAQQFGYKSYRSMDIYVRRQGYSWDRYQKKYLLPEQRNNGQYAKDLPTIQGKTGQVLTLIANEDFDLKEVAKKVGFDSHRELSVYMKAKGYLWDNDLNTFRFDGTQEQEQAVTSESDPAPRSGLEQNEEINVGGYQELLAFLLKNQNQLRELLAEHTSSTKDVVPRFAVPGQFITKSVHMSCLLDQLIRDFSQEKNISQRELFEVALVEFFRKYAYQQQVDTLLQKK